MVLDYSMDRRRVLACANGVVRVWEEGEPKGEWFGSGCVSDKWSPVGLSLGTCHEDGSGQIWVLQEN